MRIVFVAVVISLALGQTVTAQSIENQIRTEVARYVTAVNRGDAGALAALYSNDSRTSTAGDGTITRGWQRVSDVIREAFGHGRSVRMTTDSVTIFPLGTAAAVAVFRYHWAIGPGSDRRVTGAMTLVYTRTRRGWRVAHDHTSTLESAGSVAGVAFPA